MGQTHVFEEICSEKRQVNAKVLKQTVSLAVEIAREGCEGRKIGTLFVVGDSRAVMKRSKPMILHRDLKPENSKWTLMTHRSNDC